jgi:hypothetical protein
LDGFTSNYGWYEIAEDPRSIDGEYVDDFISRWSQWLGQIVLDRLDWRASGLGYVQRKVDPKWFGKIN